MVTGGSSGIGKATALALAEMGANLTIVCRDRARGQLALDEIKSQTKNRSVHLMIADLSSQASVRQCVREFQSRYEKLHLLINNAAVLMPKRALTVDGIEMTFAVNHLAYFLLTNLLLDQLKAAGAARIVNVSSEAHRGVSIDFDNLQGERSYSRLRAYSLSKLCNIFFTYELAKRLQGSEVTANCLHPGVVATSLFRQTPKVIELLIKLFAANPRKGAATSIYLATAPEISNISGKYFSNCRPLPSSAQSYEESSRARLWQLSQELTCCS